MRKIAIVPAASKVLQYLQTKFDGKVMFQWSDELDGIIASMERFNFMNLLRNDKWTELHNDDYKAPHQFKRQTMQIALTDYVTQDQTTTGKPRKISNTLIKVADKVSIPPLQLAAAKYQKLIFGGIKGAEVQIREGAIDISWSQRGGHAGSNTVSAIEARAEAAGFVKKNASNGGTPDGSMTRHGTIYQGPKGETLQVSEGYGAVSWDNNYSATLKVPASAL